MIRAQFVIQALAGVHIRSVHADFFCQICLLLHRVNAVNGQLHEARMRML